MFVSIVTLLTLIKITKLKVEIPHHQKSLSITMLLSLAYMSKRRTLVQVLPATMRTPNSVVDCSCIYAFWLQLVLNAYTRCTHWVSNYTSQPKCIHASADNNRVCIEEVPKLVYTFWICKPVLLWLWFPTWVTGQYTHKCQYTCQHTKSHMDGGIPLQCNISFWQCTHK